MSCSDFTFAFGSDTAQEVVATMRGLCEDDCSQPCWEDYPPERVAEIERDPASFVSSAEWQDRVIVARSAVADDEMLVKLAQGETIAAVVVAMACCDRTPPEAMPFLIEYALLDYFSKDQILCLIADHPRLDASVSRHILNVMLETPRPVLRGYEFSEVLARNPRCGFDVLEDLLFHFADELFEQVAANPTTQDSQRLSLLCTLIKGDPTYRWQSVRLMADLDGLLGE